MVKLFKNNETNFKHNEFMLNEIISCKVTEEINGDYITELQYPLEDTKNVSANLVASSIISVPVIDNREHQLIRIIKKETNSNSIIVEAQAKLLADLKTNRIRAMTIIGKTRKEAIQYILDNALETHNYSVGNLDINTNKNVLINIKEGNLLSAIIGSENSILSEYGGEFIVDNNTIDIIDFRGADNGVVIEYGKNISSIKETIDITDLATVLIPKSGDYRLPEYVVESPNVEAYEKRYFQDVDINLDIWNGKDTQSEGQITVQQAYTIMRETCNKMFTKDKIDQINFNYTVDFIELSKTEEYKNYKALETVNLGDTVTIRHKKLNLDLEGRVNKISYSVDSDGITTIDTVEIGFSKKNITDIINSTLRTIKFTEQNILLQVTSLDNNLNAKIELTAIAIRSEVTDTKAELETNINQTASAIRLEANDNKNNLQSSIELTASAIRSEVSNVDMGLNSKIDQTASSINLSVTNLKNSTNSSINQLSNEISAKVSEGDFSTLIKQNATSVAIAIKNETDTNIIFDSNGQTIKNGALVIENDDGDSIMSFNDGVVNCEAIGVKDLGINNTDKGSLFYNTLANMEEIYADKFSCVRLYIDGKHIYNYIVDILEDKGLI